MSPAFVPPAGAAAVGGIREPLHIIAETAQHAGIVRESLDGQKPMG